MSDQAQQNIRRYALRFREETDYQFAADYYFKVLHSLREIEDPGLQTKSLEHISRAFAFKMAGLQETPFEREFLDKSDAALDEFLALFPEPDTEVKQP